MPQFDLILFDLDGTLIDTASEIADTINDVLSDEGIAPLPLSEVRNWIGHGARETLRQAYAARTRRSLLSLRDAAVLDRLFAQFARHHARRVGTGSTLFAGVRETLQELRRRGQIMALVTNKEGRFVDALLQSHGLSGWFAPVVAGDTLPVRKPDPRTVRHCLQHCGVAPSRALLVGDSAVDVATARAAGVSCWAVSYGYNAGRPIAEARPDRVIDSLAELIEVRGATAACV
ncbi:phosphoglycolate phosphatase [Sinimarinibacterium sp. CAU 1509]|uniref:phosphoglycolate phosphatase n=1 Tax=Sinimarinibacterium sp. CAU 1509 TaxID=2562283 RepID=UPI0010ACCAAB|nr:phosphoglycolate phosphatase [Sinimarinibacterium sp. CAU 1509]TJY64830.1 phosphoglycolate phosphatase [Sinimarinibacterium sp. CAU 1509]